MRVNFARKAKTGAEVAPRLLSCEIGAYGALNMKTIEPGHIYRLGSLDGEYPQELRFVRRKYSPGVKRPVYPGTTCQDVLRAVHDRTGFLHAEKPHWVNRWIRLFLRLSIWLFEYRAAEQRNHGFWHTPWFATNAPMCRVCGHTDCRKHDV